MHHWRATKKEEAKQEEIGRGRKENNNITAQTTPHKGAKMESTDIKSAYALQTRKEKPTPFLATITATMR